ncbi:MAG: helix-turn-helix domain-containing protein, partial [Candidatus Bathyarchaeia archaeon]
TPKQLSIQERRNQTITLLLKGESVTNIAKQFNIDRSTVYADFEEWAKTEQATFLQVEWISQYQLMKQENLEEAFRALTKLASKLFEKQAKVEVNVTQTNQLNITNEVNELIKISREHSCNSNPTP